MGLDDSQFQTLFGDKVYNGMSSRVSQSLCNQKDITEGNNISLIPMYKKLSDADFLRYFSKEISLYVSQGCKFTCDFCAAEKNQKEKYRSEELIEEDLMYIMARLQDL